MAAVERMGGNRGSSGKGGSRAVLIVHGMSGQLHTVNEALMSR